MNKPYKCAISTKNLPVTVINAFGAMESAAEQLLAHADTEFRGDVTACKSKAEILPNVNFFPPPRPLALLSLRVPRQKRPDLLQHHVPSQGIPAKNPDSSACYYVRHCRQNADDPVPQCHEKIHPQTGRKEQNEHESEVQLRKLGPDIFQLPVFALCAEGEVEEAGG